MGQGLTGAGGRARSGNGIAVSVAVAADIILFNTLNTNIYITYIAYRS